MKATHSSRNRRSALVYARLPRAGLGNMLFVWARALVFSHLNDLPLYTSSWTRPRIGPFLRRERHARLYWDYFDSQNILWPWQTLRLNRLTKIEEPPLDQLSQIDEETVYEFHAIPHWDDYFAGLKPYRTLIRERLTAMISERMRSQLARQPRPCIAAHVRMGDFRQLQANENFAQVGLVRTPLVYFIDLIHDICRIADKELPVTIFSDGVAEELAPLLEVPGVKRADRNPDIVDLLLMAQSQLIICSAGSTFSYWASFLADAPVLLHPDHVHQPLRPDDVTERYFEGGVRESPDRWPALLRQNISDLVTCQDVDNR